MSANSNVVRNPQLVEYGKFVELQNDSRFPPISVIRQQYPDTSSAYNIPISTAPLSSVEIYPKYAVLTYNAGGIGGTGPGGAYTQCETRTSGNPSFISSKIYIHNGTNQFADVILTLTSGLSCMISLGKHAESNHTFTENLAVSGVNNYDGATITFFA